MKSLLVLFSYHHNNTEKIASVFARVLDAEIKTPQQINPEKRSSSQPVQISSRSPKTTRRLGKNCNLKVT